MKASTPIHFFADHTDPICNIFYYSGYLLKMQGYAQNFFHFLNIIPIIPIIVFFLDKTSKKRYNKKVRFFILSIRSYKMI